MNFATAFLDGSAVYGSTPKSAEDLRLLESGKLNLDPGRVLAQDPRNVNCRRITNDNAECLKSGDERVNHNAALAAVHTLLAREHNRIASHLTAVNPHWDEETLYQGRCWMEAEPIVVKSNAVCEKGSLQSGIQGRDSMAA